MKVYLGPKSHPYTELVVPGIKRKFKINCLIDTGFAGGLALPLHLKEEFKFPLIIKRSWKLADGSEIELDVFAGKIEFEGKKKEIAILFVNGEDGIVGIEFLKGLRFVLDLKEGRVELS